MIIKRPVYNQHLKCVAFEIITPKGALSPDLSEKFIQLINSSDSQFPLFIPFAFKSFIESIQPSITNPIILKLPAEDIESIYPIQEVKDSVYSIALLVSTPQHLAWLNFAEYIGLTEKLMTKANVVKVVQYSKAKQCKVIAYDIDQPLYFDKCKDMIMDYYCGDFLFKPIVNDEIEVAANKLSLLNLIQLLQKEECDLTKIALVIKSDPLLSYQLLRLANSAAFSAGIPITSIDQAIMRLGLINLKNWATVFSMKNISDKPIEVLESGLIRARMAQEVAKKNNHINSQSAYTAGLLSILDCLLNKPMTELIEHITLSEDIHDALIKKEGPLGELLALIIAYESGHWENVPEALINELDLSKLYIDCLQSVSKNSSIYG